MTVRVVLADDHALVREALQLVITDTPDLEVVGHAGTGADAVRLAGDLRPDVVVMDIRMPGMDGIEATRLITADPGSTRVVVLTTFDDDDYVYGALRAGASGFLVKDMALEDIIGAIRVIAAGDGLIAPGVTRRLIAEFAGRPEPAPAVPPAGRHHRTRTGGIDPHRARTVQCGDRGRNEHYHHDREDVRGAPAGEAGCPRPGPVGDNCLRDWAGGVTSVTGISGLPAILVAQ